MEPSIVLTIGGLVITTGGLLLLHVFRGPKEQDTLLRKEVDDVRRDQDQLRSAHYALAERVARDYHDKAEVRDIVTQIHSRIGEILARLDSRERGNGRSG